MKQRLHWTVNLKSVRELYPYRGFMGFVGGRGAGDDESPKETEAP